MTLQYVFVLELQHRVEKGGTGSQGNFFATHGGLTPDIGWFIAATPLQDRVTKSVRQSAAWRPSRFVFGLTYRYTHPPLHIQARYVFQTFLCVASGAGRGPEAAARRRGGDTRTQAGKHSTATHTHTETRRDVEIPNPILADLAASWAVSRYPNHESRQKLVPSMLRVNKFQQS